MIDNVRSLQEFRTKKLEKESLARGREPLFSTHSSSEVGLDERLSKIKSNLERINRLMAEIKKSSAKYSRDH